MLHPSATAFAEALEMLDAQARAAKRAEAASRKQAREIRRTMDEVRRACRELGIEIAETPRRSE